MYIEKSKYTGFCSGVKVAIEKAKKTLDNEKKLYSLGEIIHNKDVVNDLENKGLKVIEKPPKLNDAKLLIRSHGVGKNIIDILNENNIEIIDATCVKVKKIHKIVEEFKNNHYNIIIVGDKNHPEVIGILGWCNNEAAIIDSSEELLNLNINPLEKYCLVSQTTFNTNIFKDILNTIKMNNFTNIVTFNTICDATKKRQEACLELAAKSDVMLIIGGKNSSNTKKLYELSKKACINTFHIENYREIPYKYIDKNTKVGVSAGASTPDWIIEEVIKMLENLNTNEQNEKEEQSVNDEQIGTMHELFENYGGVSNIRTGQTVKGTVIYVSPEAISVNINYKSDGIITRENYSINEIEDLTQEIKEGDEIEALVIKMSDQDGNVVLTRRPIEERKVWEELEKFRIENTILDTTIIEASQYGIYGKVKGIKGFIPRNQISINRNVDPSEYVGKNLKVVVLETKNNKRGRKQNQLILSSKYIEKIEKEERDKKVWENIQEGEVYEGTVKNIQDYGAFVEINGIDGLLHITEIAWTRIKHPSDVLKTGDKINVKVKSVDKENKRLSLSYKATVKSPWSSFLDKYKKGDVVDGKVTRIVDFGAFVMVDDIECLLHIKDLDWARTEKVTDVLNEGQDVTAKILNISKKDKKISLGLKQLVEHPFDQYAKNLKKDDIIQVEVTRILLDGVHVKVNENIDSFMPINKVSNEKLRTPAQVVKVGEIKDAKILGIDMKNKKLNLTFILEDKSDEFSNNDTPVSYKSEETNFTIGESIGNALEDLLK
ncbi:bifunctional 4-hydroxy-3-methylbut-2-enyl diphosphate reductase/30S ribosomal protein S1 [Sedimentibacter sp. MB31-C6]|uniref:bifunctional 4-hydroxy-3-methylbut-2-enyl diphosphate reductase/30S ribosomal protein S1 n=1 Tax=Sedimentibacter sp. MB31-C6 TaxID=3109366 RepID=UPI002DDCCBB2|nr:bifunctional 4-hydroxy-3-methylbut-2-enyl diphosphate reductase/30S ribosomal protein S1 [Sedimentibacter sp. MB36-C1]WSI04213.1 bifunctional 4-hydroxy-3-methylbut-2-enyl diphosphate reductase/30S ribosomal protein S1 [Sedimentibacter sp. MB36-C1]